MIKILIIEDDYRIAEIHKRFLEELDYVTVVGKALTGKEAIEIAGKNKVDLVLLDLYLPDLMGEEIIDELRKTEQEMDFVVVTAASEKEIVGKLLRSGIFDYIIKPVIKERLLETVARYREFKKSLLEKKSIEQNFLDDFFGVSVDEKNEHRVKPTPKGIDPLTLEKVREILFNSEQGITADKLGEKIGASRTTARRYLEFLISEEEVVADLRYGTIGRPERIYFISQ
ncbi:response regulator [Oceanobacillus luteolus]|uniref:Response regulator n=1 Tax=Oceanobacillus luteolus TaxID=1274358 RepID=A0ABW4HWJ0_9BACI|nr:response regulator [Oceanobacillus luteolus]MCM3740883.1 response regulator [Oceanobacillus luteolus]